MYRIDNSTASLTMPTVAAPGPRPNGFFTKGNPLTPTPATIVDDDFLNTVQEEVIAVLVAAGIIPSKASRTQLRDAINALIAAYINFPDPGTAGLIVTALTATGANLRLVGNGGTTPNKTIRARGGVLEILNSAYSAVIASLSDLGDLSIRNLAAANGAYTGAITAAVGTGFSHYAIFSSPGLTNFTVPATRMMWEAWGGGGGGGSSGSGVLTCGSGGGSGGYSRKITSGLTVGGGLTITVGAGGAAGGGGGNGGNGAVSSVSGIISANGGNGGPGQSNAQGGGGSATGGDINLPGASASSNITFGNYTVAGNNYGGCGGTAPFGGPGGVGNFGAGNAGAWPGGGGGGAGDNGPSIKLGGAGANGGVILWW